MDMDKIIKRHRKAVMNILGVMGFLAFLVMCSEPAPGVDMELAKFVTPKVFAILAIGACVWVLKKIDK